MADFFQSSGVLPLFLKLRPPTKKESRAAIGGVPSAVKVHTRIGVALQSLSVTGLRDREEETEGAVWELHIYLFIGSHSHKFLCINARR